MAEQSNPRVHYLRVRYLRDREMGGCKSGGNITIVIRKNSMELFDRFMENVVMPLKKKYPHADIRIEVQG